MTTPGLGLALGGGAVLGAAHLGALRVLEERGLQPEFVAGTSAGALVGAAYAAGLSLDAIDALMREGRWHDVGRLTLSPRLGILDPRPLDETVAARVGVALIEDLPVAFGAVTTDLLTRQEVVLTRGSLARALRASIAIPGLFPPVVDGLQLRIGQRPARSEPPRSDRLEPFRWRRHRRWHAPKLRTGGARRRSMRPQWWS
jgi:NTE family protein